MNLVEPKVSEFYQQDLSAWEVKLLEKVLDSSQMIFRLEEN